MAMDKGCKPTVITGAAASKVYAAQKQMTDKSKSLPAGSHIPVLKKIAAAGIHPNARSAIKGPGQK